MNIIENIMTFIKSNFNDNTFERYSEYLELDKSFTYDDFLQHNEECLKNLYKDDLDFIYILINKINNSDIMMVDEETIHCEWAAYSIYFNSENKLVIMHPR